jgi:dihydroorotate dehydrogenase
MFATKTQEFVYKRALKPFLFSFDPETVHDRMCSIGKVLGDSRVGRGLCSKLFSYRHKALEQTLLGIHFQNPVGLTAGFDKNAELTQIMPSVGFGFEVIGSVTGEPCVGNAKPRLWRLPKSKGLVVYSGLKNDGCEAIANRLSRREFSMPIGVSVAKTNSPDTADPHRGVMDYKKAMETLKDVGDYFVVNISCPNAFGGEPFADPERLDMLLDSIDTVETQKPILLKVAVDISPKELNRLIDVADNHRVHGFILSNLTKDRTRLSINQSEVAGITKGGISGKPTTEPSNRLISHLYKKAGGRYVIVGVGGIFTARDAYEKIQCGASLVQLATGMIFQGPQVIGQINKGLVNLLKKDGFDTIAQAVGSKHR